LDSADIVKFVLMAGIMLTVTSVGLRSRPADTLLLLRNPRLGVRAMVSMFVLMPLFVIGLTSALPVMDQAGHGGRRRGLCRRPASAGLVIFNHHRASFHLACGTAARRRHRLRRRRYAARACRYHRRSPRRGHPHRPRLAARRRPVHPACPRLPRLAGGGRHRRPGVLLAIAAIVLFGLLVGHLLGGPDAGNRGALALATSARHPGLAIALSTANFPHDREAIIAAVLLFLLANLVLTLPYALWRRRRALGSKRETLPRDGA
jgi:hypothetical protein